MNDPSRSDVEPAEPRHSGRMTRARWAAVATGFILIALGIATWVVVHRAKPITQAPAITATTVSAHEITITGNVTPRDLILVAAPVEGVLEVMEIPVGGEVLMGQIIGRLVNRRLLEESESAEAQLTAAQERIANTEAQAITARLEAARASAEATATEGEMDRAKTAADRQDALFKEGATSRNAYELAKKEAAARISEYSLLRESARASEDRAKTLAADLDAAKKVIDDRNEAIKAAAENLRAGEVLSPIDGVLASAKVLPGDMVSTGTKDLFAVARSALKLAVTLEPPPEAAALLKEGLDAQVTLTNLPDTPPYPAKIVKTATGQWQAQFDTPELVWKPNDMASVRIHLP